MTLSWQNLVKVIVSKHCISSQSLRFKHIAITITLYPLIENIREFTRHLLIAANMESFRVFGNKNYFLEGAAWKHLAGWNVSCQINCLYLSFYEYVSRIKIEWTEVWLYYIVGSKSLSRTAWRTPQVGNVPNINDIIMIQ